MMWFGMWVSPEHIQLAVMVWLLGWVFLAGGEMLLDLWIARLEAKEKGKAR